MKCLTTLFLFVLLALPHHVGAEDKDPANDTIQSSFSLLTSRSFEDKSSAIKAIADSGDKSATSVLTKLLQGNIYYHRKNKQIVSVAKYESKMFDIFDLLTGEKIGSKTKKELRKKFKKVGINNKLRSLLNDKIATLTIYSEDKKTRLEATRNILKNLNASSIAVLRNAIHKEEDVNVKKLMRVCIAIADTKSNDPKTQLDAINSLSGALYPEVRVILTELKHGFENKPASETNVRLLSATTSVLQATNLKVGFYKQIENIFFGLSLGSVLLLAAVGLAITFGVMGVINMAHGEMLMLGAYTAFVVQQLMPNAIGYSLFIAIPAAFIITGLVGIGIERGVIRFLYGRPLETLLATFGLSLILQQAVRSIFSPLNRSVVTPAWMSGSYEFNPALSLTYNRIYIVIFALLVLLGLLWLLKKTSFGLQMRAVTQNRNMAKAMGIRTNLIDSLTFGLGSGIAGVGGVALSQLTNVGPNLGQSYIVDSFMVVVFGGVGNLWGTFFGAMTLGIANKFMEPFTGAVFAKILLLIFIILFIQRYPRGMFALKGRAAEN